MVPTLLGVLVIVIFPSVGGPILRASDWLGLQKGGALCSPLALCHTFRRQFPLIGSDSTSAPWRSVTPLIRSATSRSPLRPVPTARGLPGTNTPSRSRVSFATKTWEIPIQLRSVVEGSQAPSLEIGGSSLKYLWSGRASWVQGSTADLGEEEKSINVGLCPTLLGPRLHPAQCVCVFARCFPGEKKNEKQRKP